MLASAAGLFDGINLDWEFPGIDPGNGAHYLPTDRINATALVQEFRRQLDQARLVRPARATLLTIRHPGRQRQPPGELAAAQRGADCRLDRPDARSTIHGGWEALDGLQLAALCAIRERTPGGTPPRSNGRGARAARCVHLLRERRALSSKLVLGIPFYGKEYVGVPGANHGLYQGHGPTPGNDTPSYSNT